MSAVCRAQSVNSEVWDGFGRGQHHMGASWGASFMRVYFQGSFRIRKVSAAAAQGFGGRRGWVWALGQGQSPPPSGRFRYCRWQLVWGMGFSDYQPQ